MAMERAPRDYSREMGKRLEGVVQDLRADIEEADEPQVKAIFETSAEVIEGLIKAMRHYEEKKEAAWR